MKKFVLLLIVAAFFGAKIFAFDIGFFQLSFYRILVIISVLLIIISLGSKKSINNIKTGENYFSYLFMLLWLAYAAVTFFFAKDFNGWFKAFTFIASGVISIWYIGLYLNEKKDFYKAFFIIEFFIIVYSLHGYYEVITGDYRFISLINKLFFSNYIGNIGLRIPISVFGNPNNYALFCMVGFYISSICSKIIVNKLGKAIIFLTMVSSVILLLSTQSRAGFIGFCLSLIIFMFLIFKNITILKKFSFIFIVIVIILTLNINFPDLYKNVISDLITINIDNQTRGSDFIRVNLIKNGIIFLKQTLFMGVGVGNIEYYMAKCPVYYVGRITNIHNWWMEILVSSGIFIFFGYVAMYIRNIILLRKISKKSVDENNRFIANALFCFMIAFIVSSMGASSHIYSEWLWVFWGIIFAFVSYATIDLNRKKL